MSNRALALLLLTALPAGLAPLFGFVMIYVSAAALAVALVYLGSPRSSALPWRLAAMALALAGGLLGAKSSLDALGTVGYEPAYAARAWLGWAAGILALVAGAGGLLAQRTPGLAAAVILVAGVLGTVASNLFYVNAPYVFAAPLWLLAAISAIVGRGPAARRQEAPNEGIA